jgi:hypothetical protein
MFEKTQKFFSPLKNKAYDNYKSSERRETSEQIEGIIRNNDIINSITFNEKIMIGHVRIQPNGEIMKTDNDDDIEEIIINSMNPS